MGKGVLVDTCIWIEYFRSNSPLSIKLEGLIELDAVYTSGIVLYELFQGIENKREKATLEEVFKGVPHVYMSTQTWINAALLSSSVKRKGNPIHSSDIFLAQLAIENNMMIFTKDTHFKKIPGVTLLN